MAYTAASFAYTSPEMVLQVVSTDALEPQMMPKAAPTKATRRPKEANITIRRARSTCNWATDPEFDKQGNVPKSWEGRLKWECEVREGPENKHMHAQRRNAWRRFVDLGASGAHLGGKLSARVKDK